MAPQFIQFDPQAQSFQQGYQTFAGLDEVFNRALQMGVQQKEQSERLKMAQRQQEMQMQEMNAQRGLQRAQLGFDPYSTTPGDFAAAQDTNGVAPGSGMLQTSGNLPGLTAYLQRQKQAQGLGVQEKQAGIEKEQAQARLYNANADLFGSGAGASPETVTKDGITYRKGMTAKGEQWLPVVSSPEQRATAQQLAEAKTGQANAAEFATSIMGELDRISPLNEKSYQGAWGKAQMVGRRFTGRGTESETFTNTADVVNTLRGMVSKVLKSTFGGQLSDGERQYLDQVYGAAPELAISERRIAIQNIKTMISNKSRETSGTLERLRGGRADSVDQKQSPEDIIKSMSGKPRAEIKAALKAAGY